MISKMRTDPTKPSDSLRDTTPTKTLYLFLQDTLIKIPAGNDIFKGRVPVNRKQHPIHKTPADTLKYPMISSSQDSLRYYRPPVL